MQVLLSKLIPMFIYPLGLVSIILLVTLLWLLRRRQTGPALLVSAASIIILVAGNGAVAAWVYRGLESQYPPVAVEDLPSADVIVVLGGGLGIPLPPRIYADLNSASDRLLHASRLYRAGRARHVIVSGGNVFPQEGLAGESVYAAQLLTEWGVPEQAIIIEKESRNTVENAALTKRILKQRSWDSVLLVTSAAHMPRAVQAFERAGVPVFPAAIDYVAVNADRPEILDWVPNVGSMYIITLALKEYLGRLWYQVRG